jgi:hypothetical protein
MLDLLSSSALQGVAAIVAIITALIPVVSFIVRKTLHHSGAHNPPDASPSQFSPPQIASEARLDAQDSLSGCARGLIGFFLGQLITALTLFLGMGASGLLARGEMFRDDWQLLTSWSGEAWREVLRFSCLSSMVEVFLLLIIFIVTAVMSFKRGVVAGLSWAALGGGIIYWITFSIFASGMAKNSWTMQITLLGGAIGATAFVLSVLWLTSGVIQRT